MSGDLGAYYVVWDGVGVRNEDGSPAFITPHVATKADKRMAFLAEESEPRFSRNRLSRAKRPEERIRRCNSKDLRELVERSEGWQTVGQISKQSAYSYNQARNALYMLAKQGIIAVSSRPVALQRPICIYAKLGTPRE